MQVLARRGLRRRAAAARGRQLRRRRSPATPDRPASRSRSASRRGRASTSTGTRCAGRSGASASASRRAKGWCCTPSATTTRAASGRSSTAPRSPTWSCRTAIRARPTSAGTPSTSASTASACSPTRSSSAATASARSATSTPSCNDSRGEPVTHAERDLHARGGLRHPLEAHRLAHRRDRGAPLAPAGRLVHRHRRQLRVRLLLVLLPGRHDPARGQADRHHLERRRRCRARRRSGATLVAPQVYAPIHQHFFNVRLDMMVDGPTTRSTRSTRSPTRAGPENPHGNAFHAEATLLAHGVAGAARSSTRSSARFWKIVNPSVAAIASGEPVAYKLMPGENVLPFAGAELERHQARGVHDQAPLGDAATTRASATPPATTRTSTRAATACPSYTQDDRADRRTPTSWSGTPSARTTSSGPRTGR